MNRKTTLAIAALSACAMLAPVSAAAQTTDNWQFGVLLYGYFPDIGGKTTFPGNTAGGVTVDASDILSHLKGGFLGTFEARKARWGAFTDVLYLDVGGSKSETRSLTLGGVQLPVGANANLDFNMKGLVWTLAGEYRIVADSDVTMDLLAGARLLDIKQTLNYDITGNVGPIPIQGRTGNSEVDANLWDGIIGVKGRIALGAERKWFVPYYADVGTGDSEVTWQIMGGLGYSFSWGDIVGGWRYLDYQMKSGSKIEDVSFNGPMIGVAFHW